MQPTGCTESDKGCTRKDRKMRLTGCIEGGRSCNKRGGKCDEMGVLRVAGAVPRGEKNATNWYTKGDRTLYLKETKNGMI